VDFVEVSSEGKAQEQDFRLSGGSGGHVEEVQLGGQGPPTVDANYIHNYVF